MDYSPPGSSVHGILQARILERVAMPSPRGSSRPRDRTRISCGSCIAGRFFTAESPGKPRWVTVLNITALSWTRQGTANTTNPSCPFRCAGLGPSFCSTDKKGAVSPSAPQQVSGRGPTLSPFPAKSLGASQGTDPTPCRRGGALGRGDGCHPVLLQLPAWG